MIKHKKKEIKKIQETVNKLILKVKKLEKYITKDDYKQIKISGFC